MILNRIKKDKWDLLAYSKDKDTCQVLDFLSDLKTYRVDKEKMMALLRERVPTHGPGRNENLSKKLKGSDHVFEFKRGPKNKGLKVRVLYFYDENRVIVCTSAFMKSDEIPEEDVKNAEDIRTKYRTAKRKGKLKYI